MTNIIEQDFLDEIRYVVHRKDIIKARVTLSFLDRVEKTCRKKAMLELSRADDDFIIPLIAEMIAKQPKTAEMFPELKEILIVKIIDHPNVILDLIQDETTTWEKAFLIDIIGEIRLEAAVPVLLKIIDGEADNKEIESAIMALGMIGEPEAVHAVSEYLYSGSKELIVATIFTLGQLATPSAIRRLAERIGGDSGIDQMIMEIFSDIQSPEALEKLNEILGSHYAHLRSTSKQKLVEIGPKAVPVLMKNLRHDDPDFLIHTLNVLGDIGDESAVQPIRKLLHHEPENANVRFAAYEALGMLPLKRGAFALAAGLEDPVDNVRAAAAKAIDRNYDTVLSAGMKNLIKSGGEQVAGMVHAIVDSQCGNIFIGLVEEDAFIKPAIDYLVEKAHPVIRAYFAELLFRNDYSQLSGLISGERKPEEKARLKVFAVDDSRMVLNIYRSFLHNLEYDPHLFEFPADAIEQVKKEKPAMVFTDLNMPDITGIELTRVLRKSYDKDKLPIVMVTTQNDAQDNEAAITAGVNSIMYKPFTQEQVDEMLKELFP